MRRADTCAGGTKGSGRSGTECQRRRRRQQQRRQRLISRLVHRPAALLPWPPRRPPGAERPQAPSSFQLLRRLLSPPRRMWESPPGLCVRLQAELKHTATNRGLGWASDITAAATAEPRAPAPGHPRRPPARPPGRGAIPAAARGPRPAPRARRRSGGGFPRANSSRRLPSGETRLPITPGWHHLYPNPGNARRVQKCRSFPVHEMPLGS